MKRALLLATALSWVLGCGDDDEKRLTAEIDGIVYLNGPVAGATVKLRRLTGTRLVEASATTDADGRYRLTGLGVLGDMQLEVDVSGLPWTTAGGEQGTYPDDVVLRSPVPDVDVPQRRRAHVTALTTLLVAVADARAGGAPDPAPLAVVDDFARWLTLVPVSTPFDAAPEGVALGRRHALLLEAFVELAGGAADQAGVPAHGVISAPELLNALLEDAVGGTPAAFFDGRGADGALSLEAGPGRYDLSEATLRSSYAAAVRRVLATPRWSDVPDREVADLLASLAYGSAPMFGACVGGQPTDTTVPVISDVQPAAESPLVGAVEITVRADDPESGIAGLSLSLSGDGSEVLPDLDDQPSVARVRLDTAALGGPRLELLARAENRAGLVAERRIGFPLANVPPGVIEGVVVKGPASRLRVTAYGVRSDGSTVLVGSGRTGDAGAFEFAVEGWRGPLLVRAQGDPTHPDGASGYLDEARWSTLPWDAEQSLSALVPEFDPERPSAPVIVTPLTDLAWARALGRGAPLLDNHEDAAALLAAHFALPSSEALRTLLPADPETPTVAPGDAHRYLFALGCLARQALDVAETLAPEALETFTALDLVAWYRADLAADGEIDGAAGNEALPLEHEGRALTLEDPFRADLAASCARWLADPANPSGLTRPQLTEPLRAIANDTGALFDPAHAPTPFDVDGPSVEATLEPVGEGATAGLRTNGAARLTLTLRDAAGIVDARVEAPEGLAVTVERAVDLSTTPAEVRWVALVEPGELPDGPLPFAVHADDALGNQRVQTVVVVKDTAPPTLSVTASDGVDTTYEFAWYTQREQFEARFQIEDAGPWRIVEQTWSVFDHGGEP